MVPHNQHLISALQRQASRRLSVRGQRERGKVFIKFALYFFGEIHFLFLFSARKLQRLVSMPGKNLFRLIRPKRAS